jgi:glycogen debranching enzyme
MEEMLRLEEQFAIVAEPEHATAPLRVLKAGDAFAVFDAHGNVVAQPGSEHGLYYAGTRFLSRFELLLAQRQPLLLSSSISEDNIVFTADLTNPDLIRDGHVRLPRGTLHLFRTRLLMDGSWLECVRIANHGLEPLETPLIFRFDADFADVFEVRGTRRRARGQRLPGTSGVESLLRYRGLDGMERRTRVRSLRPPDRVTDGALMFYLMLAPHSCAEIEVTVDCEVEHHVQPRRAGRFTDAVAARRQLTGGTTGACTVVSSNDGFNRWMQRSTADLRMMITDTPYGPYPYAGIPWYSTPFGRDGLITAFELLWAWPEVARGVLAFLAETQATTTDDASDAQPGKILHEMRSGEMAALGEIPFGRYYGTADATPLFVALAAAYYDRTTDLEFVERLWPNLLAALEWIDHRGDLDGDGFVEYARRSATGLIQQGWKDSWDSVFHADGTLAEPPIALCEVQAYAFAAWSGAARLAQARGNPTQAEAWRRRASALQMQFERAFWCEELGTYALALDAAKQRCEVRTSNPGHCLFTGIVEPSRAERVAATLMSDSLFGGWGIRTVAAGTARYNPMSYHNGSMWPHDNAIVAAGLARYGQTWAASRVFSALFDLSRSVAGARLPELICGFHRRPGMSPTLYPVACAPQTWAAGAVYLGLQASLGLTIDAAARRLSFDRPLLPESIDWLRITNLTVGTASVDLLLTRHAHDVAVTVLRRDGDLQIVTAS